jgi:hypothetical protein
MKCGSPHRTTIARLGRISRVALPSSMHLRYNGEDTPVHQARDLPPTHGSPLILHDPNACNTSLMPTKGAIMKRPHEMRAIPSRRVIATFVVTLAAGAGIGVGAAAASGAVSTIHTCANNTSGILRLARACTVHEHPVIWNVQGPQGTKGPRGAKGPQGSMGPRGSMGAQGQQGAPGVTELDTFSGGPPPNEPYAINGAWLPASGTSSVTVADANTRLLVTGSVTLTSTGATPSVHLSACAVLPAGTDYVAAPHDQIFDLPSSGSMTATVSGVLSGLAPGTYSVGICAQDLFHASFPLQYTDQYSGTILVAEG